MTDTRNTETTPESGAPDDALSAIVREISSAHTERNHAALASLVEANLLEAWYGLGPERLREVLADLVSAGAPSDGLIHAMHAFLTPTIDTDERTSAFDILNALPHGRSFALTVRMFELRLGGRPTEAMHIAETLRAGTGELNTLIDHTRGWRLFASVQHGITAMLAGDLSNARTSFVEAQLQPPVSSLGFLTRDAYVKKALLHALYGNPERARHLLGRSHSLPRTSSWAEALIDAHAAIAAAIVDSETPHETLQRLNDIPLHAVGELWPYYLLAQHRALVATGDRAAAHQRLRTFANMPLPREVGQGLTGSIIPLIGATDALALRSIGDARAELAKADPNLAITHIITGVLELASGRLREALALLTDSRPFDPSLRTLELWRVSIIASAQLGLGASDDCRDTLRHVLRTTQGLQRHEPYYFSSHVRAFAEEHVDGWPVVDGTSYYDDFPPPEETLTERELDVLSMLAQGLDRAEIARAQFISLNTLKTHLRSVYRKLGVSSRTAAILEAQRRGLV